MKLDSKTKFAIVAYHIWINSSLSRQILSKPQDFFNACEEGYKLRLRVRHDGRGWVHLPHKREF